MIPYGGLQLPFIDQTRRVAVEHDRGIDADHAPGVVVDVQQYLARGRPHGGRGLPASLGAFDEHRPGGFEQLRQLGVDDARQVVHPSAMPFRQGNAVTVAPEPLDGKAERIVQRVIRRNSKGVIRRNSNG